MRTKQAAGPHIPPAYEKADIVAIQACVNGTADADQQRRAMDWIIREASGAYQFHFYPTDRETAFALGRGFVGQQIVKMTRLNAMREE